MKPTAIVFAGMLVMAGGIHGFMAQDRADASSTPTFNSKVNLVLVPVVVRDGQGRAVDKLTQDDFKLYDKGRQQVITKFEVERSESIVETSRAAANRIGSPPTTGSGTSAPALPDNYIAYLVDDVHLERGDLVGGKLALNRHLDHALDSATRAAIFTTSGRVLSDFTSDREKLKKAVASILPWSHEPDPQQDCFYVNHWLGNYLVNGAMYFSGVLYSDDQLKALAASDYLLKGVLDHALLPPCQLTMAETRGIVSTAETYFQNETRMSVGSVMDVVRRLGAMPGTRTIVLASPGFLMSPEHRAHESDAMDQAIRENVTINAIDLRGLYSPAGSDVATHGSNTKDAIRAYTDAAAEEQRDAANVLAEFANATGGTFFHNDNDLDAGLNLVAKRPEVVYLLGFSPENLKHDGAFHDLKVRLTTAGKFDLQMRKGYWAPGKDSDPASQSKQEMRDTVFSRDEVRDFPLNIETSFFKAADGQADLTVTSRFRASDMHFNKTNDRNLEKLTIVTGVFDSDGRYVLGKQIIVDLKLKDQTLAQVQQKTISLDADLKVHPGRYIVRVVVRDEDGKTMAARNAGVEIE